MVPIENPAGPKPFRETLLACQILFSTRVYLAKNLVTKLEPKDLAVAYREVMVNYTKNKFAADSGRNRYHTRDLAKLSRVYSMLSDYVTARPGESRFTRMRVDSLLNPSARGRTGHFFAGPVPSRVMRFGDFLYYRGVVSRETLDSALVWQRSNRPLFGQIAVKYGMLSVHDFARVLVMMGRKKSFGETARDLRLLSEEQVAAILKIQSAYNCPLGKYFVENGMLDSNEIVRYLREMHCHNRSCIRDSGKDTRIMKLA